MLRSPNRQQVKTVGSSSSHRGVNLLQELFQGDLVVVALVYKHLPLRGASLVLRILQDHASSHEQIQVR